MTTNFKHGPAVRRGEAAAPGLFVVAAVVVLLYVGGRKLTQWGALDMLGVSSSDKASAVGPPATTSAGPPRALYPAPAPALERTNEHGIRERYEQLALSAERIVRHGAYESWYPGGAKRSIGQYDHDLRSGEWTHWDPAGQRLSVQRFEEGRADGRLVVYHPNGKIRAEGDLDDGAQHGCWTYYDEAGVRLKVERYDRGAPVGEWQVFDSAGRLRLVFSPTNAFPPDYLPAQEGAGAECGCKS